jgi:hypothetical protein
MAPLLGQGASVQFGLNINDTFYSIDFYLNSTVILYFVLKRKSESQARRKLRNETELVKKMKQKVSYLYYLESWNEQYIYFLFVVNIYRYINLINRFISFNYKNYKHIFSGF